MKKRKRPQILSLRKSITTTFLTIIMLLFYSNYCKAQSGKIWGQVYDKNTFEAIPFANITFEQNDVIVGGTTSDIHGNYFIDKITPGIYTFKTTYIGYGQKAHSCVRIQSAESRKMDFKLEQKAIQLEEIIISDFPLPLICSCGTECKTTYSCTCCYFCDSSFHQDYKQYEGNSPVEKGILFPEIEFTIYPNPCKTHLNIKPMNTNGVLILFSIDGKLLKQFHYWEGSSKRIDLSDFSAGKYLIQFQAKDHEIITKKIIFNP